jgi:threonyl-tRNA synthetase
LTFSRDTQVEGLAGKTTPLQAARECGHSINKPIVALVDNTIWDLNKPLTNSCQLRLLSLNDSFLARKVFWHSSAHVLGWILEKLFCSHGHVELCDGPPLSDGGFYYDVYISGNTISEHELEQVTKAANDIINYNYPFERLVLEKSVAKQMFKDNRFKLNFINQIPEGEEVTAYKCGDFVDLCKGPHIPNTDLIKAFKMHAVSSLSKVMSSYLLYLVMCVGCWG